MVEHASELDGLSLEEAEEFFNLQKINTSIENE
jgi:hypothetical protein